MTAPNGETGLRCDDRTCDPSKGDAGCLAYLANEHAHDGLDGMWLTRWDNCPLMVIDNGGPGQ